MSFGDYQFTNKTPEESARELSTENLKYELTKEQDEQSDSIVLIKESLRRILNMIQEQDHRCNCCKASKKDDF